MNYEELSYSIEGFTSRYICEERQKPFFDKYYERIVAAMIAKSKSVGRVKKIFFDFRHYSGDFCQILTALHGTKNNLTRSASRLKEVKSILSNLSIRHMRRLSDCISAESYCPNPNLSC